ncbi:MAG: threonine aldolase [Halioglobus sp.]|jgi:threonine aldolase
MIDLRSDTFTKPSNEMKEAMFDANIGDDVYGEDPTVNALEQYAAKITGKESAVFASSGTQSNLMGLLSHCQRGHEYIVGSTAHTYMYEGGGAAVLGGIQPCTIPFNERGEVPLDSIAAVIKPDDNHFAITRLLCLENTQGGKVLDLDYINAWSEFANSYGLKRHLDGARLFNAAVQQQVAVREICQHFDTVSICLSKGLGCPMGSLLVGDESTIKGARRWRKMLGGGLRQAGMVAAAGLFALNNNIERLAQDHANARRVGDALRALGGYKLAEEPQTNMVMLDSSMDVRGVIRHLQNSGIRINGHRWVFHMDVSERDTDKIISACTSYEQA